MLSVVRLVCLFCALSVLATAGDLKWFRRASSAAVCAASAFDVWSTHRAVGYGAIETNPFVSTSNGQVRWGRASVIKLAFCSASIVIGETHLLDRRNPERADKILTVTQFGMAGALIYTGIHNTRVANRLQNRPSYMMPE